MSQIEQDFSRLLGRKPEIEKCYSEGLINRRALARDLKKSGIAKSNQIEATIAMLRRFPFSPAEKEQKDLLKEIRISLKDDILILNFEKSKELLQKLQKLVALTDYDKGDTLKIVVGTTDITLYLDEENEKKTKDLFSGFKIKHLHKKISEFSLAFPEKAISTKGITAALTRELSLHGINIEKMLTSGTELLLYIREEQVLRTYEILKRFQER